MSSSTTVPQEVSEPHRPSSKSLRVNATFAQAADASMERCALYLFKYVSPEVEAQLSCALQGVRRDLRLPPPHHELLDCRDWPQDDEAGDALGALLDRLEFLERVR